ncbi:hypothetical protein BGZ99_003546, partial [Dissophora globulifera]
MPQDKNPKVGKQRRHRQKKKRGSRGSRKRGSGKGRKKSACRVGRERYINLAANQKAVARPTLQHRRWLEKQKAVNLRTPEGLEPLFIGKIESSLPHLRGAMANFGDHVRKHSENRIHLDKFYNRQTYKKHQYMAKKARQEEFHRLADSLLRMVGGSIGERRKEDDMVVIGIGLGQFASRSRLSSLNGTFESFFVQK